MNTRKVLTLASMVAMLFAPVALGAEPVIGEKLDSGLGELSPGYAAEEFQRHVIGEKLDSGLGELPTSSAAAQFQANTDR